MFELGLSWTLLLCTVQLEAREVKSKRRAASPGGVQATEQRDQQASAEGGRRSHSWEMAPTTGLPAASPLPRSGHDAHLQRTPFTL